MTIPPPSFGQEGPEFRFTSLTQTNRRGIVELAGSTNIAQSAFVEGTQFQLSALGATLDLTGGWAMSTQDLAAWRQVTTQGRDQYVRVVYYGYLFPLGHPAILVNITDRIFVADPANPSKYADAYLQNITFIRVVDALKTYPALGQPFSANSWPFTSAQILTLITPDIDPPEDTPALGPTADGSNYPQSFFPTVGGNDVLWSVRLVDNAGTIVALQVPLAFVSGDDGSQLSQYDGTSMEEIAKAYNALGQTAIPSSRVTSPVAGTLIQYAPEVTTNGTAHPGATTHPTLAITLGASTPGMPGSSGSVPGPTAGANLTVPAASEPTTAALTAVNQPAFYPSMIAAQVRLPAAETLSRSSFGDSTGNGVVISYYGDYVQGGFPASLKPADAGDRGFTAHVADVPTNLGSVYAGLVNTPQLNFPSDTVGGVANPNLVVKGLSAAAGAIGGDLSSYASSAVAKVEDYFSGLTGQLNNFLGGLPLGWLPSGSPLVRRAQGVPAGPAGPDGPDGSPISGILGDILGPLNVPTITQELDQATGTKTVTYTLVVALIPFPTDSPIFQPLPADDPGNLTLKATVTVTKTGTTTYQVTGVMDPFTITILSGSGALSVIEIPFGSAAAPVQPGVTFSSSSGAKTQIHPNVGQPTFLGILSFVNSLERRRRAAWRRDDCHEASDTTSTFPSTSQQAWVTMMGLDPINYVDASDAPWPVVPTSFGNLANVPVVPYRAPYGDPPQVYLAEDDDNLYQIWPYGVQYDTGSQRWFADVNPQPGLEGTVPPPPGYFIRLALVRFQPYSQPDLNVEVSPVVTATLAQPVPDRTVSVTPASTGLTVSVEVYGPAYQGWRPPDELDDNPQINYDLDNVYAPQSPRIYDAAELADAAGSLHTSTVVVEVQTQSAELAKLGFEGELAWATTSAAPVKLPPAFTPGSPNVLWGGKVTLPDSVHSAVKMRLRISEIDYYAGDTAPAVVDTSYRRPFVCLIPIN